MFFGSIWFLLSIFSLNFALGKLCVLKSSVAIVVFDVNIAVAIAVIANLTFYPKIFSRCVYAWKYFSIYNVLCCVGKSELAIKCCTRVYEYFHDSKISIIEPNGRACFGVLERYIFVITLNYAFNNIKLVLCRAESHQRLPRRRHTVPTHQRYQYPVSYRLFASTFCSHKNQLT